MMETSKYYFRAWDGKRMIYFNLMMDGLTDDMKYHIRMGDWPVMQFTGRQDILKAPIFNLDIVNVNHPYDVTKDFKNTLAVVFYDENDARYLHAGISNGRPPKAMWEYVQIVGNAYQNPEMLRRK